MAVPLGMDLRVRVMKDVDAEKSADRAAVKCSISARTIYEWKKLRRENGSLEPRLVAIGRDRSSRNGAWRSFRHNVRIPTSLWKNCGVNWDLRSASRPCGRHSPRGGRC